MLKIMKFSLMHHKNPKSYVKAILYTLKIQNVDIEVKDKIIESIKMCFTADILLNKS